MVENKKNVYVCFVCGEWFATKDEKRYHVCKRVLNRDGSIASGDKKHKEDPDKEEKRSLGARLIELGVIKSLRKLNFRPIEEVREMVKDAELEAAKKANADNPVEIGVTSETIE
jgi:hypothetical protein